MEEHYFLFGLGFIWTFFASVQDLKKREVANWLNFSLIAFALAYRAFYSAYINNFKFLLLGVLGFGIFFALAYAFYYGRIFAGGDAKLLMGFGVLLPYASYSDLFFVSLIFIVILFCAGAVYGLSYSFYLVVKNKKKFALEFRKICKNSRRFFLPLAAVLIILFFISFYSRIFLTLIFFAVFFPVLYSYAKALDKCMIKLTSPEKLTEGDWLEKNVRAGKTTIKKSVHGLNMKEIKLLRQHKKKVFIKEGIPFVPAFLISLITVFFFLVLELFDLAFLF